jgi:hypothetical protein
MKAGMSCVDKKRPCHLADGILKCNPESVTEHTGLLTSKFIAPSVSWSPSTRELIVAAKVIGGAKLCIV